MIYLILGISFVWAAQSMRAVLKINSQIQIQSRTTQLFVSTDQEAAMTYPIE